MRKNLTGIVLLSGIVLFSSVQASLNSARMFKDQWHVGAGFFPGAIAFFERVVEKNSSFGVAFGLIGDEDFYVARAERESFNKGDYFIEGHFIYRFFQENEEVPMDMGLLLGAYNDKMGSRGQFGIVLDLYFSDAITGRFNVVTGPRLGVEVGYLFQNHWELNITLASAIASVGIKFLNIYPTRKQSKKN